jgi:lysophospholipid acyltransferase 1/2
MFFFCFTDDDFLNNTSIIYKLWYMMMSTTIVRFKYYFAWLLADAICNNSGLGFNGYDKDGIAKWDLISNIYIIPFEVSPRCSLNSYVIFIILLSIIF